MAKKIEKFPEEQKSELVHKSAKAAVSMVPGVGGAINEFFDSVIKSPLEKRRTDWLNDLAKTIMELEEKVGDFSIEKLTENDLFLSTILRGTDIAMKNHQEEKREALKAAIQNTALEYSPEENIQLIFMNYIDTLTPWHLKLLKFFNNPIEWGKKHNIEYSTFGVGYISSALECAFPDLQGKSDLYNGLITDLYNYSLLSIDARRMNVGMTGTGMLASRTTSLGQEFIKFITSPLSK